MRPWSVWSIGCAASLSAAAGPVGVQSVEFIDEHGSIRVPPGWAAALDEGTAIATAPPQADGLSFVVRAGLLDHAPPAEIGATADRLGRDLEAIGRVVRKGDTDGSVLLAVLADAHDQPWVFAIRLQPHEDGHATVVCALEGPYRDSDDVAEILRGICQSWTPAGPKEIGRQELVGRWGLAAAGSGLVRTGALSLDEAGYTYTVRLGDQHGTVLTEEGSWAMVSGHVVLSPDHRVPHRYGRLPTERRFDVARDGREIDLSGPCPLVGACGTPDIVQGRMMAGGR